MSVCAVRENETLDSVGVMGSSASRICLADESEEHPDTNAQAAKRARREMRVSIIMGVFDGKAMNPARSFGEPLVPPVAICIDRTLRDR